MMDEIEWICPECDGSGEGILSAPGTGRCKACKGTGTISNPATEEGEDEEERLRKRLRARGYNLLGKKIAAIAILLGGLTIFRPGELPIRITENPMGVIAVDEPGKAPTIVLPAPDGGLTAFPPGEAPINITPDPGGGGAWTD